MGRQLDLSHIAHAGEPWSEGCNASILVAEAMVVQVAVHIVLEGRTNLTRLLHAFESLRDFSDRRDCLRGQYIVRLPITGTHIEPGQHRLSDLWHVLVRVRGHGRHRWAIPAAIHTARARGWWISHLGIEVRTLKAIHGLLLLVQSL